MKQLILFITALFLITACSSDDIDIVDNSFVIALEPSKTEVVVDEHFTVTVHSEDEVREMWVSLKGGYAVAGGVSGALTVSGAPYGVVWAGGFQGLVHSAIKGDDMKTTLQNVGIGLTSGFVARYVNVRFDTAFTEGLLGGNNMLNSVVSESTKAVFSNFSANFIESGFKEKF